MAHSPPTISQILEQADRHLSMGQLKEAEELSRQILAVEPAHPKALHMLGFLARRARRPDLAIKLLSQSIAHQPNDPGANLDLGNSLLDVGRFEEAIAPLRAAIALVPTLASAHSSLGIALHESGQTEAAMESFETAAKLNPSLPDVQNNLSKALNLAGQPQRAEAAARAAIAIRPGWGEPYLQLANALRQMGQIAKVVETYRHALKLKPDWHIAHSNLLFNLYFLPNVSPLEILREHESWNDLHARVLSSTPLPFENQLDPDRVLNIGYVAPDFREHSQSFFTMPLISNHDRSQFNIFCYSDVARPDEITKNLQSQAMHWRSIVGMDNFAVADRIREDGIDILVDLTMHMAGGRPLLFALKPAPLQVTWLAYPGTTGLRTIDYRFSDPYLDPPGVNDPYYSEQTLRLPDTFWCYDPLAQEPEVNALPAETNGYITFGCLSQFAKTNEEVLKLWSRIFKQLPTSRMVLLCPPGDHRVRVRELLQMTADRIDFVETRPRPEYLKLYHKIDLCLDTFPYNGHTTSLDAYWMGVPTVSRYGALAVARAGLSQATNLGLTDLVTEDPTQFIQIAVDLAQNLPRLKELRKTLRQRLQNSPLMDGRAFAKGVESLYRTIWRAHCETPQTQA